MMKDDVHFEYVQRSVCNWLSLTRENSKSRNNQSERLAGATFILTSRQADGMLGTNSFHRIAIPLKSTFPVVHILIPITYFYLLYPFREERNVIEAAAKGASTAISLVANVAAMLITFFAFIAFFNAVLSYLGSMVGYSELSFQASSF